MKKIIKSLFFLIIIGMVAAPVVLVLSGIEQRARVEPGPELSFDNVKRVKQLIFKHKPRYMRFRQTRRISIQEKDLNLLLTYAVSQGLKTDQLFSKLTLSDPDIILWVTLKIPHTPLGEYVNFSMDLKNRGRSLEIASVRAGRITLPGFMINPFIPVIGEHLFNVDLFDQLIKNADAVKSISINRKTLNLVYDWNPASLMKLHESGKALLIPRDHQKKLVLYTNQLTRILSTLKRYREQKISLARVIRPLFQFAAEQAKYSRDPVLENRSLLQSLSLYVLGKGVKPFVNADEQKRLLRRIKTVSITLSGRNDLTKHFLVSAGLAVSAGGKVSHFAGLAKEVTDAVKGSGFSFADLAADKAGVRLGELATASKEQAQRIQAQMGSVKTETDFMPRIGHLPEGIMELEFKKKYTDLDSQAYAMINDEISRRINACRVYQ